MKKILTFILVLLLGITMLAGCGNGGSNSGGNNDGTANDSSSNQTSAEVTGETRDNGLISVFVPDGWWYHEEMLNGEPNPGKVVIYKGAKNEYDLINCAGMHITHLATRDPYVPMKSSSYSDVKDLEPMTLANGVWEGFSGERSGAPYIILWDSENVDFQVALQLKAAVGDAAISLDDADVQAIITSIVLPEKIKSPYASLKVRDEIEFGGYEWIVLDVEDQRILIISKNKLEDRKFHLEDEEVTWETCELRAYLNGDFYDNAFSEDEKEWINESLIENKDSEEYGTAGGNDTVDRIFLLSVEEAERYFDDDADRNTDRAEGVMRVAWWLRTPGFFEPEPRQASFSSYQFAIIQNAGQMWTKGASITDKCAIRPVLWLNTGEE